jgi:RND family efflux transporter MFP subunit
VNRLALTCVLLAACHRAAEPEDDDKPAPAAVTCKAVAATTIDELVEVTGVIAPPPKADSIVSSPIAGRVGQVAVEEGDHVEAGALLAVIEDPALPAGSLEAKAAVASAQATKAAADQDLARQQRLVDSGIGARRDLDEARAKAAAAAAELDAAGARSGLATKQLARRELRAPRAGVVLHLWKRVGESVEIGPASPVAEVADLSVLEVHAQVTPVALAPIREKMTATVAALGADGPLTAIVVRVAPAVDPVTLLGSVRLAIDGGKTLKIGTAATARISIAQRPGVRVPTAALRRSQVGGDEVVVCEAGVAKVRTVTVGQRGEAGVELVDGVKAGEQVVVDHVLGLEDGQPLTAAPAQGSAK